MTLFWKIPGFDWFSRPQSVSWSSPPACFSLPSVPAQLFLHVCRLLCSSAPHCEAALWPLSADWTGFESVSESQRNYSMTIQWFLINDLKSSNFQMDKPRWQASLYCFLLSIGIHALTRMFVMLCFQPSGPPSSYTPAFQCAIYHSLSCCFAHPPKRE